MHNLTRRDFIRLGLGAAAAWMLPARKLLAAPSAGVAQRPPPLPYGRVIGWNQPVHEAPDVTSRVAARYQANQVIALYYEVSTSHPQSTNPVWYRTRDGFIHSSWVQPVETDLNCAVITKVPEEGFWGEICVPSATGRWDIENAKWTSRILYYQTVYRVTAAARDSRGQWWYQLREGVALGENGPYVPAWAVRYIPPYAVSPISPEVSDKHILINIREQSMVCYEGTTPVFTTRISSGREGTATPIGEFRVLYKRFTRRMAGDNYDLAGVPFPVYITNKGVAVHGTYWHNDYGQRHSHGCVNIASSAARWVFRWVEPVIDYTTYTQEAEADAGTPVTVINS